MNRLMVLPWGLQSPVVANIYMEYFKQLGTESAGNPPQVWNRYVDDTSVMETIVEML